MPVFLGGSSIETFAAATLYDGQLFDMVACAPLQLMHLRSVDVQSLYVCCLEEHKEHTL